MRKLFLIVTALATAMVPAVLLLPSASASVAAKAKPPVKLSGKVNDKGTATATGNAIELDQSDFAYTPTYVKVPAGATSVTVTVKNMGSNQHTFTVPSQQIDKVLNPGDSVTVTLTIPHTGFAIPFYCRFHKPLGMQGAFFDKKGAKPITAAATSSGSGSSGSTGTTATTHASGGSSGGYGY